MTEPTSARERPRPRALERDVYHAVATFQHRVLVDFRLREMAPVPDQGFIATILNASESLPLDMLTPEWVAKTIETYRSSLGRKFKFTTPYLWCGVEDGSMVIDLVTHARSIEQVSTMLATGQIEHRVYDCHNGRMLVAMPYDQRGGHP